MSYTLGGVEERLEDLLHRHTNHRDFDGRPTIRALFGEIMSALEAAQADLATAKADGMRDAAKLLCWACQQGDKPLPPAYPGDWWAHPKVGMSCNAGSIHEALAAPTPGGPRG